MKYKSNNNIVYSCKYHVVWCPKYRRKVLVDGIDSRLKELADNSNMSRNPNRYNRNGNNAGSFALTH